MVENQEKESMVSMETRRQWTDRQRNEERERKIRQKILEMEARKVQDNYKVQYIQLCKIIRFSRQNNASLTGRMSTIKPCDFTALFGIFNVMEANKHQNLLLKTFPF